MTPEGFVEYGNPPFSLFDTDYSPAADEEDRKFSNEKVVRVTLTGLEIESFLESGESFPKIESIIIHTSDTEEFYLQDIPTFNNSLRDFHIAGYVENPDSDYNRTIYRTYIIRQRLPDLSKFKNLRHLGICNFRTRLDTILPDTIVNLPLQSLVLDRKFKKGGIKTIPNDIGRMKLLTILNLNNNSLSSLPESIIECSRLRDVYLAGNPLRIFPLLPTSIVKLDLRDTKISSIPDFIGNYTKLQLLNLDSNPIRSLPDSINNLINLKELFLVPLTYISNLRPELLRVIKGSNLRLMKKNRKSRRGLVTYSASVSDKTRGQSMYSGLVPGQSPGLDFKLRSVLARNNSLMHVASFLGTKRGRGRKKGKRTRK